MTNAEYYRQRCIEAALAERRSASEGRVDAAREWGDLAQTWHRLWLGCQIGNMHQLPSAEDERTVASVLADRHK